MVEMRRNVEGSIKINKLRSWDIRKTLTVKSVQDQSGGIEKRKLNRLKIQSFCKNE